MAGSGNKKMIDYIIGTVKKISEKTATVLVNNLGLSVHTPQLNKLSEGKEVELYAYLHWNQEKGPTLYGFENELEKTVFLIIIDCPKIGPGIALKILSQIRAAQFLEIITTQNDKALSAVNGIGIKKAEHLISFLKHKVSKLISTGAVTADSQQDFVQWQNITEVLTSLNYSKPEISGAIKYLMETHHDQNYPLDKLIRAALGYLSGQKNI